MLAHIKKLTSDTAIYGISSIAGRFLNFLLVPLYTNVISRADYGIVASIYSYMAFMNVLLPLGLESAFMRYVSNLELGSKKDTFSAPLIAIGAVSILLAACVHLAAAPIASLLEIPPAWKSIVPLCGWTLAVDAVCVIPFASLRMENRAARFAMVRTISILLTVLLNLRFIGFERRSIEYIFIAGLIGSGVSLLLLLPEIRRHFTPSIARRVLAPLLRLGIPTIPAGIAGIMLQVIDRPIMLHLTDADTVGLYQANYKLGIFMMLIVAMFQYAWQPFYLQLAREPDAPPLFARVLTYFLLLTTFLFLALSFFIEPLAKFSIFGYHLLGREFWPGLEIVPVILLSYIFTGIGVICSAGLLIEKRTGTMPLVMGASAALNVAANLVLIPRLGIWGGALSTLASYLLMAILYWRVTAKVYPVPYEYARLLKIALAGGLVSLLFFTGWRPFEMHDTSWSLLLLALFGVLLVLFRFFASHEFRAVRQLLRRLPIR